MIRLLAFALAAAAETAAAPDDGGPGTAARLGIAAGLLLAALALLVLEFFIVSGGMIAALAGVAAIAANFYAFSAGDLAGWTFVVLTPILAVLVLNWGIKRVQRTSLVVQAEITEDAGYGHRARELGVAVGSRGELVTAAYPTGRGRFAGGEIDVVVRGPVMDRGSAVEVVAIEGPTVFVSAPRESNRA